MSRDILAETALRDATRGIINSRLTYSASALTETLRIEAELALIARSEGTVTREQASGRICKAIDVIAGR